ncbi:hypothetical protein TeGR_g2580 [Tetraparma gracilis]|uniref:Uncharacterized protein n=1 Tax=Tetraparma gracilis TaxID=2962635 RepID=A0ABQ6MLX5_9STRA|nr:hypothetical protein TeGR_g2580 [Tetraparma gracilis]
MCRLLPESFTLSELTTLHSDGPEANIRFIVLRLKRPSPWRKQSSLASGDVKHAKHTMLLRVCGTKAELLDPNGSSLVKLSKANLDVLRERLKVKDITLLRGGDLNRDAPSKKLQVPGMEKRGWCLYIALLFTVMSVNRESASLREVYESANRVYGGSGGREREWFREISRLILWLFELYAESEKGDFYGDEKERKWTR